MMPFVSSRLSVVDCHPPAQNFSFPKFKMKHMLGVEWKSQSQSQSQAQRVDVVERQTKSWTWEAAFISVGKLFVCESSSANCASLWNGIEGHRSQPDAGISSVIRRPTQPGRRHFLRRTGSTCSKCPPEHLSTGSSDAVSYTHLTLPTNA